MSSPGYTRRVWLHRSASVFTNVAPRDPLRRVHTGLALNETVAVIVAGPRATVRFSNFAKAEAMAICACRVQMRE
jgi:hypothetical protein